jgi:hypothetical protein
MWVFPVGSRQRTQNETHASCEHCLGPGWLARLRTRLWHANCGGFIRRSAIGAAAGWRRHWPQHCGRTLGSSPSRVFSTVVRATRATNCNQLARASNELEGRPVSVRHAVRRQSDAVRSSGLCGLDGRVKEVVRTGTGVKRPGREAGL